MARDERDPSSRDREIFEYHAGLGRRGKIEVVPTKPLLTQRDLSLAYSPGVARPCEEIAKHPELALEYTARGNLVAVVSNGTAVLGLGDIGALASKPVMEGKGCLFKKFADIDVFDLEISTRDPDELIEVVANLEPTFGGINLEDIKAPECFYIERELKARMGIPVFHDDQHGTAIISGAALLNGAELTGKALGEMRLVVSGAGAAAIAGARFFLELGIRRENLTLCDSRGVVYLGRQEGMNPYKAEFAVETEARTLAEALVGADVFLGFSVGGLVTPEMVKKMADQPLIFAMANPDPEIAYPAAKLARPDAIVATGRSDFPNQVNNVLGFPAIFRAALDVAASEINVPMMVAAARALAALAKEDVPESVRQAYGDEDLSYGPEYVIPKPFDPRVLTWEATAVAEAAMQSGVARRPLDLEVYRLELEERIYGRVYVAMREVHEQARSAPQRVVFPDTDVDMVLRAADLIDDEGLALPILLGQRSSVDAAAARLGLDGIAALEVIDPRDFERFEAYCEEYSRLRQRHGVTVREARYRLLHRPSTFAMMMLLSGDADAAVLGLASHFPEALKPVLELIPLLPGVRRVSSMHMVVFKNDVKFFTDCAVNVDPSAEDLAHIAILAADEVKRLGIHPRVAMVSYSSFGASRHPQAHKVARATAMARGLRPDLELDGEMQLDVALDFERQQHYFPFSRLQGPANVLVFPHIDAGNAAYKMAPLANGEAVGPILLGLAHPVEVLERGATATAIARAAALAAVRAQRRARRETAARAALAAF